MGPKRFINDDDERRSVGLPPRSFLYTIDQIAALIGVEEQSVIENYLHLESVSVGVCPKDKILARNIAPAGQSPEWRIPERYLIRWLRFKGFKYYDRGWVSM